MFGLCLQYADNYDDACDIMQDGFIKVFRKLDQAFTVEDLGGWTQTYTRLVEALWQKEVELRLDPEPAPRLLGTEE